ncbi:carbon-nitrogen hydrolase family protein [Nocardioides donggukensis]|uniref:Carbon-nitrogen hydrolase family protein n=1 Tax=Nocardioides donggukensis TaxID=2774019 RepID=A0A927K1J8_9ACTN|nr:carbon-nitrogen hydrolase family protein [Nocardioides donggukensis]MBD8868114.1 carbon-nitrogen hydrolase family protein [Nocardioides donggukensis]
MADHRAGPQPAEGTLRVALVQQASDLDPAENRAFLDDLAVEADLVVLPEAFARDFGSPGEDISAWAEPQDGPFDVALRRFAGSTRTVVAGMFEVSDDPDRPWNTLLVRGAAEAAYRKIHLYDSFGYRESDRLSAGEWDPVLVEVGGFGVGLLTCYDLRFPELARDLVERGADLLVVPAAWVPGRTEEEHRRKIDHWTTLARARAIENTTYVAAVGQAAPRYTGHSIVVDPLGEVLAEADGEPTVLTATLDADVIAQARAVNPSLANRRDQQRQGAR